MPWVETITRVVGTSVLLPVGFLGPFILLGVLLHQKRKRYRAEARDPFTQLPLRPAGESLRERIDKMSEEYDSELMTTGLACFAAVALVLATPASLRVPVGITAFFLVCAITVWTGIKTKSLLRDLWDCRLGYTGERVVGEELNQLLASGFRVFHDIPFDGFNIDHVIVGSPGVYAVETKTRRKPAHIRGPEKATVEAFGDRLEFPTGWNEDAVRQARLNAKTLGEWLTKATGERVVASAILTLPGWRVMRRQVHDVNVLNPEEIKYSFPRAPKNPLTPEQMKRIVHQLTERCRMEPAKS